MPVRNEGGKSNNYIQIHTQCRSANEKTCYRYDILTAAHPHPISFEKFHPGIHLMMKQYRQHLIFFFPKGYDFNAYTLPFQVKKKFFLNKLQPRKTESINCSYQLSSGDTPLKASLTVVGRTVSSTSKHFTV